MARLRAGAGSGFGEKPRKNCLYIKYGDLGKKVTPEVKQVLDSDIYIEWPEGVRNEKWVDNFFVRLVGGIRGEQLFCGSCQNPGSGRRISRGDRLTMRSWLEKPPQKSMVDVSVSSQATKAEWYYLTNLKLESDT